MQAIRSKPIRRRLDETAEALTTRPGLTLLGLAALVAGTALFITMLPEMRRYLLAARM